METSLAIFVVAISIIARARRVDVVCKAARFCQATWLFVFIARLRASPYNDRENSAMCGAARRGHFSFGFTGRRGT
jgi:hypothetical protein